MYPTGHGNQRNLNRIIWETRNGNEIKRKMWNSKRTELWNGNWKIFKILPCVNFKPNWELKCNQKKISSSLHFKSVYFISIFISIFYSLLCFALLECEKIGKVKNVHTKLYFGSWVLFAATCTHTHLWNK